MESSPVADRAERVLTFFERLVVRTLTLLQMFLIGTATVSLFVLLYVRFRPAVSGIQDLDDLQVAIQRGFGGVLLVLLGLELLETLRTYFVERRIRLEVVMTVALIAIGRHVIQLDYGHIGGLELFGIAGLILALSGGYFLIRKSFQYPIQG